MLVLSSSEAGSVISSGEPDFFYEWESFEKYIHRELQRYVIMGTRNVIIIGTHRIRKG